MTARTEVEDPRRGVTATTPPRVTIIFLARSEEWVVVVAEVVDEDEDEIVEELRHRPATSARRHRGIAAADRGRSVMTLTIGVRQGRVG